MTRPKKMLVVDIGGHHVKLLATGHDEPREIPSGRHMDARKMVGAVRRAANDWRYDVVSLGYPGRVHKGRPVEEPTNLKLGWLDFDYAKAFGRAVRIMNDAAMQALGSYQGGRMLFLGLGTGLGSTLIIDRHIVPLSLGDLPFRLGGNFGHYLAGDAPSRLGKKRWQSAVDDAVRTFARAFETDYIVLGGGKADLLTRVPPGAKRGENANAFIGGYRLWEPQWEIE